MPADLHIHSIYSDGSYAPNRLVEMAAAAGLNTIALTDHDTLEGVPEAIQSGKERGVEVIPAVELSALFHGAELHILAYYLDYKHKGLQKKLKEIFKRRIARGRAMVEKLNQLGIDLSWEEVQALAGGAYVGRPHIARAMLEAGYISKREEAFTKEYIGDGGQAYLPKYELSPQEAIDLIKEAGGIPVVAHPALFAGGKSLSKSQLKDLKEMGLLGIEVYHTGHSEQESRFYRQVARELGMLITGGSDFHGENSPDIKLGDIKIHDGLVDKLKSRCSEK